MNKSRYSRFIGVLFVTGAVLGILISLFGLIGLWGTKTRVVNSISSSVALISRSVEATRATVDVVTNALDQATTDLASMRGMIDQMGSTLKDSKGMVSSASTMIGKDLVGIVNDTQRSLTSVVSSARLVDDFLRVVSAIPFIGGRYKPDVTLEESFAQVNNSLTPLPEKFTGIQRELDVASANVAVMQSQMEALSGQMGEINQSLDRAKQRADDYRSLLTDVSDRVSRLQARLPVMINGVYMALTALLVWMLITQLGMLMHGLEMVSRPAVLPRADDVGKDL